MKTTKFNVVHLTDERVNVKNKTVCGLRINKQTRSFDGEGFSEAANNNCSMCESCRQWDKNN
jgi:hypothetical protein